MILASITAIVLLVYITSFVVSINMYARCVLDYGMLAYTGFILWKLIIEDNKEGY